MATKNIVPRANNEGSLGTSTKKWASVYATNFVMADGETVATKISNQNTRITTAEGSVTTLSGTVDTLSSDVTTLYGNVETLSDGKADKSTTYTKTETDTELAKKLDLIGGTITGTITINNINYPATHEIGLGKYLDGADLVLIGKESSSENKGNFILRASDGTNTKQLQGTPSGALFWANKEVERVNSYGTNYTRFESGLQICWGYGYSRNNGAYESYIDYPVAFSSNPAFTIQLYMAGNSGWIYTLYQYAEQTAQCTVVIKDGNGQLTKDKPHCRWIAIGRWK